MFSVYYKYNNNDNDNITRYNIVGMINISRQTKSEIIAYHHYTIKYNFVYIPTSYVLYRIILKENYRVITTRDSIGNLHELL